MRTARKWFGRVLRGVADGVEALRTPRGELLPPPRLRRAYYGTREPEAFRRASATAAQELIGRGLKPHHRVLDVGCGAGNLAVALARYLGPEGGYDGLDVHAAAVAWCQRAVTPLYPDFRFQLADLHSKQYNPRGRHPASEYRFPFDGGTFDYVFVGSVCTHLLPDAVAHYLEEIARVLKPGGRCVSSFFLLDDASRRGVESGTSFRPFAVRFGASGCLLADADVPETAVAHDEGFVRARFAENGLAVEEPVYHGGWWRGEADHQDVITAVKLRP